MGRALATALLLALAAPVGALCLMPASRSRAAVAPGAREPVAARVQALRTPDAAAARADGAAAFAGDRETAHAAARACPDLGPLVAERAGHLRERTRSLERDWVADCEREARAFDAHCARELLRLAGEPARESTERLAALSLAGADAALAQELAPDRATLAWLQGLFEAELPSGDDERPPARDAAHVAALCLAWLGGPPERARLVQALGDEARAQAAAFGLLHARHADVAPPFVAALEAGGEACQRAMLVVVRCGGSLAFPLAPEERARAVDAVERWWLAQSAGSARLAVGSQTLTLLDADAAARAWNERLDAHGFEPGTARWSVQALLRSAAPADRARVETLLGQGEPAARLEVALAVLERMPPEEADSSLRTACGQALTEILLASESPEERLEAVRALARSGLWSPVVRSGLETAAADPDERVRKTARFALAAAAGH